APVRLRRRASRADHGARPLPFPGPALHGGGRALPAPARAGLSARPPSRRGDLPVRARRRHRAGDRAPRRHLDAPLRRRPARCGGCRAGRRRAGGRMSGYAFQRDAGEWAREEWRAVDRAVYRWVRAHGGSALLAATAAWTSLADGDADAALPL